MENNLLTLRTLFDSALDEQIRFVMTPIEMLKPMVYSLKNGGKRLRPLLLLSTLSIQSTDLIKSGLKTAIALEYIHTYSLIHDDLPAMDDDEIRRGQPTNHIQFDEATAILAGDALLTDAFGIIVEDDLLSAETKNKLIFELSRAAGSHGMVAGQLSDIQANEEADFDDLVTIHSLKTGKLFTFAVKAAAIIAELDEQEMQLLVDFSEHFGRAYQIHNDIMDVEGTEEGTGKKVKKDQKHHKVTYPSLLGLEASKQELKKELDAGKDKLRQLNKQTNKPYQQLNAFLDLLTLKEAS
ncbi:polyprenyl synthetase family protein [Fundicoccus culcitae]|uniref:Polyprenyl synthetase family protein n=1 Tax=Fundicoccus culcitae TaxID=2969821 RepID=A0ABY5P681_9LACT|nr:farnesyl diphosphate synthase [Fundicoccus culcitae]UUX34253.1 polyprenyl synthetase family protein [Fundicoccus culcitae]